MSKKFSIVALFLTLLLAILGTSVTMARPAADEAPAVSGSANASPAFRYVPEGTLGPLACPALAGYGSNLESPNYCVYYNNPPTSNSDAALVQGHVDDYWVRYDTDYGFNAPLFTAPKLEVTINGNSSCNGSAWDNYIDVWDGCFDSSNPEIMQFVVGHEIFHRVQFASDPDWATTWSNSAWIYEGTARNMEDVAFANIDTWANCLGATFSYCDEVNDYLADTSKDITSWGMRYEANLFWTYFREQFGTVTTEPNYGIDAMLELWDQMATAESVAAVNNALAVLAPGTSFDDAFRQFAVAIYTKDLTGVPDASYNFVDEDQAGNPAPYGPVVPSPGGTIQIGTSTSGTFNPARYGISYASATPHSTNCPVVTVDFTRTAGSSEFYHVITQNGNAFNTHVEGSGASWSQSFLNDGLTKVVAIIGGQSNSPTVDVEFSCTDPVIDIELPNSLAPAYVGPAAGPDDMIIQVSVTDGSPTGPVVGGLTTSDFKVEVGGVPGLVLNGGFVQEEYFLLVDTPSQAANGPYDLEVFLEEPGTSTVIASDTETDTVIYDNANTDHIIVTDVSGSMNWDGKMEAAKDAADLFIDASNSTDGLGLVSYATDVEDTLAVQFAGPAHRMAADAEVSGYTPGGATSIGDGLDEAANLRGASITGNLRCQFTLLSDGMENQPDYWADVKAAVQATGCPVMTIAFGQASNETLMQQIATDTGGASYYNDVFVSASGPSGVAAAEDLEETQIELADTYLYALCEGQGCERLYSARHQMNLYGQVMTDTFTIDPSVYEMTAVLDWGDYFFNPNGPDAPEAKEFAMGLISPSGETFGPAQYAFDNDSAGHVGYRIEDPEAGLWQAVVIYTNEVRNRDYQIMVVGQTPQAVEMILPSGDGYSEGDYFPLYAMWLPGGHISATVTAPDGTPTIVPMTDGDNDGFYQGQYTLLTQAPTVQPADEEGVDNPPDAEDQGAYRVHMLATHDEQGLRRETQGSFAISGDGQAGVPDDFIAEHCPGAPTSDADLDKLLCEEEYYYGTDPNNSDSDFDGESDESEAERHPELDPLLAGDDEIEAPDYVQTVAQNGSVLVNYDVKGEYVSMLAYRATSPGGPWNLVESELPLSGTWEDTGVSNDNNYYYCVQALDDANAANAHWSAVVCSESVEPRQDPILPEAAVVIDNGAPSTEDRNVLLSFVPADEEHEGGLFSAHSAFDDIVDVLVSNDPSFAGATWQPFPTAEEMEWVLEPGSGYRTVYVKFRDVNGNESAGTESATILLEGKDLYLPFIMK